MKYIKTATATNTDIDNSNVVIDLTGEECPKFVATGNKESNATSLYLPTIVLITPLQYAPSTTCRRPSTSCDD